MTALAGRSPAEAATVERVAVALRRASLDKRGLLESCGMDEFYRLLARVALEAAAHGDTDV